MEPIKERVKRNIRFAPQVGDIYQIRKSDILINHNKNELLLPREEQIPYEKYKKGETIRAIIKEVRKTNSGPQIIV